MNILIANTQEFNPQIGGVERVSSILAEKFEVLGHKVYFVAYFISPFSNNYKPTVEQFILPRKDEVCCKENVQVFSEIVLSKKIDVVLNQAGNILDFSNLCFDIKKITNVKLVSVIHIQPDYRLANLNKFRELKPKDLLNPLVLRRLLLYFPRKLRILKEEYKLYNNLYKNSNATVLLSRNFISDFVKLSKISNLNKLTAIPNPIPFDDIIDNPLKKKQVLFVGRIDFGHKRPDRLLHIWSEVCDKYPDWQLVFLGDGPYMDEFKLLKTKLKLKNVKLEGFKDPRKYYEESQIICMTSTIEGWGMVLVEAQVNGCIPIAYNTFASLNDIIEEGVNGYMITPFDSEVYADKLSGLMRNENLRVKMMRQTRISSEKFQSKRIADEWIDLFNKLI